jgi:hypothetical protein
MEVLLLITVIAVAAAGLFIAITFNTRIKLALDPGIDETKNSIINHVSERTGQTDRSIAQALRAAEQEREAMQAQREAERRALQDRLDGVESKVADIAKLLMPGLEGIRSLAGQVDSRQAEFGDSLQEAKAQIARLSESLAREFSQAQEIERLAKGNESVSTRKFADLDGSLREIKDQHSATVSKLAEISNSLDQCLEMARQAERHDNWTAEQLLIITDRAEALLGGYGHVAGYLRCRLDDEIARANTGLVTRVVSSSLYLSQPTGDIVQELFASFCEQLSLSVLLPPAGGAAGSGPYLLWRSPASQRLEDALSSRLSACTDDPAGPHPGLSELQSLLVVLHASGSGTIRLGPMIINRTPSSLLGCVLTDAEALDACHLDHQFSPSKCEERLRGQWPDRLIDLTSWADSYTLVSEDREAS